MTKRVIEWLDELPDPLCINAKSALDPDARDYKCDSLVKAIWHMCSWAETAEGFDYWDNIFKMLQRHESLNDHPQVKKWNAM